MPPSKQIISVRIDRDVLEFFKSKGGHQARTNAVLRSYMDAKQGSVRARSSSLNLVDETGA